MRLPLARHRGPTRFAPQARKRSWPKVTTHMAGRDRKRISLHGAGVRRHADARFKGERRSRPPLPRNGIRRGRASLRCGRSTPIEFRCPLSRRRSWASVFRPMAWPSPDRRF